MAVQSKYFRCFCPKCFEKHQRDHDALVAEYSATKVKIMHEVALRKMEKSYSIVFSEIEDAIKAIEEMERMKPEAFLSADEIITAIMLYSQGYFFKINHKVLKYKVDFFLPDEKICLEIDGYHHDVGGHRARDGRRDVEIREELGSDWEIVRIPTSYVEKYPAKIGEAAEQLAWKQRELRQKNHGALPNNYSKSVKAYYEDVLKY